MKRLHSLTVATATALLALGCESPPTAELAVAQSEFQRALDGDADVFAPSTLDDAEAALKTAREKVAGREYRAALSAALDCTQRSRDALTAAETAKRRLQAEARTLVGEADAALEALGRSASLKPLSKVTAPTAECISLVDQGRDFTDTLRRHLDEADLVSVSEEVPIVKGAVAQAKAACASLATPPRRAARPRPFGRGSRLRATRIRSSRRRTRR